MAKTIISVENLSKQYRLGLLGTGTLSNDLYRLWCKLRGKEDPFLKIGEENNHSFKGNSDFVWALRDINFRVKEGEVLGIVGANGAGKSTLLKILSRITLPTTGEAKIKGRVSSLLEVGTGFHPELTGRENIFLNGAILGMSKKEIKSKFEEIVAFSGVERYIDTPIKRYSSGMKVRLGFAVAAHLEPEILIVDEVLAVGDEEFRKKCLGKMETVSRGGRTILFVSHNLAAVRNLCTRCLLMAKGRIVLDDSSEKVIEKYLSNVTKQALPYRYIAPVNLSKKVQLLDVYTADRQGQPKEAFEHVDTINLHVGISVNSFCADFFINFKVFDHLGNALFYGTTQDAPHLNLRNMNPGKFQVIARIPGYILKPGRYTLTISNYEPGVGALDKIDNGIVFFVRDTVTIRGQNDLYRAAALTAPQIDWSEILKDSQLLQEQGISQTKG